MKDRPFLLSGILGLGAVIMTFALSLVGPRPTAPLPAGFITPVLAFAFAATEDAVAGLFAPVGPPAGDAVRHDSDQVSRLAFLHIDLYGSVQLAFSGVFFRLPRRRLHLS